MGVRWTINLKNVQKKFRRKTKKKPNERKDHHNYKRYIKRHIHRYDVDQKDFASYSDISFYNIFKENIL